MIIFNLKHRICEIQPDSATSSNIICTFIDVITTYNLERKVLLVFPISYQHVSRRYLFCEKSYLIDESDVETLISSDSDLKSRDLLRNPISNFLFTGQNDLHSGGSAKVNL